ncbi:hypothetical protein BT96DRAFT_980322 [Gymnopus androsaceus JB14]|uniref:Uncharacterized protein n=1 Tax=Gymnopus androsaceus JB14 TaxID=1447944 RepID=A0A6A4GX53_9AGAR|nr:hypothetical protein BT96DRAFT_980322 [Gymnopus androsaceus JB14]
MELYLLPSICHNIHGFAVRSYEEVKAKLGRINNTISSVMSPPEFGGRRWYESSLVILSTISIMTPEEAQKITLVGAEFLENISALIFLCALNGVYILAFIISIYIFLRKEINGRARKAFIAFLMVGLGLVTLYSSANIVTDLLLVNSELVVSLPGGIVAQEIAADSKSLMPSILQTWAGVLILLMADTAMIWRAWEIQGGHGFVKWVLLLILLLDIGINIADAIVDTSLCFNPATTTVTLDWLSILLNLMVNVVATLLIAYRAWKHHQLIQPILYSNKTPLEAILLLFVESGAILGVIQISNAIIQALDTRAAGFSPIDNITLLFSGFYTISAAINPAALVIIVQMENTSPGRHVHASN